MDLSAKWIITIIIYWTIVIYANQGKNACKQRMLLDNPSGFINVLQMEDLLSCQWLIRVANNNSVVKFIVHYMDLELNYDSLFVLDGENLNSPLLVQFTGKHDNNSSPVCSTGTNMLVVLSTDHHVNKGGFSASYEAVSEKSNSDLRDSCASSCKSASCLLQSPSQWLQLNFSYFEDFPAAGAAVYSGSKIYQFGGFLLNGSMHDMMLTWWPHRGWERCCSLPEGRAWHVMKEWRNWLIVHGGRSKLGEILNDTWAFDMQEGRWMRLADGPALYGHAAVVRHDAFYLFGGIDSQPSVTSHISFLNLSSPTVSWDTIDVPVVGEFPKLAFHTLSFEARSDRIYAVGGLTTNGSQLRAYDRLFVLDFRSKTGYTMELPFGVVYGHSVLEVPHGFLVFGGENDVEFLNELHFFDYECHWWAKLEQGPVALGLTPRSFSTFVLSLSTTAWLIGGFDGHVPGDAWSLNLLGLLPSQCKQPEKVCSKFLDCFACILHSSCVWHRWEAKCSESGTRNPASVKTKTDCLLYGGPRGLTLLHFAVPDSNRPSQVHFLEDTDIAVEYSSEYRSEWKYGHQHLLQVDGLIRKPLAESATLRVDSSHAWKIDLTLSSKGSVSTNQTQMSPLFLQWPNGMEDFHFQLKVWFQVQSVYQKFLRMKVQISYNHKILHLPYIAAYSSAGVLCSNQSSCLACLADSSCLWCAEGCHQRLLSFRCKHVTPHPSQCQNCSRHLTCQACSKDTHCQWHTDGTVCGPLLGEDSRDRHCPTPCSQRIDCSNCLHDSPMCSWCHPQSQCVTTSVVPLTFRSAFSCYVLLRDAELCPSCRNSKSCSACLQRVGCGWCADGGDNGTCQLDSNLCINGSLKMWQCNQELPVCGEMSITECVGSQLSVPCLLDGVPSSVSCWNKSSSTNDSAGRRSLCHKTCLNGVCGQTGQCSCNLGYVGANCQVKCNCNLMETCSENNPNLCFCSNDTEGVHCGMCRAGLFFHKNVCSDCKHFCNSHSSSCHLEVSFNRICDHCQNNTEGNRCDSCKDGFFRVAGSSAREACIPCKCNGHGGSCNKNGLNCRCLENTRSACNSLEVSESCWEKQCSECIDDFIGHPARGRLCYRQVAVNHIYCLHVQSSSDCYDVASGGKLLQNQTLAIAVLPSIMNIDLRITLDITQGGVDLILVPRDDVLSLDRNGQITYGDTYWRQNEPGPELQKHFVNKSFAVRNMITWRTVLDPTTLLSVKDVRSRLILTFPCRRHPLQLAKFYLVLLGLDPVNKGTLYFRQDQLRINNTVIILVFMSTFFMFASLCIAIWRMQQNLLRQRALRQLGKQFTLRISRPFAHVDVCLDSDEKLRHSVKKVGVHWHLSASALSLEPLNDECCAIGTFVMALPENGYSRVTFASTIVGNVH